MSNNLFLLTQGIGNVMQTIPLYLELKQHIEMDVAYFREYPTDSVQKAGCFPCDDIREFMPQNAGYIQGHYDMVIAPPIISKKKKNKKTEQYEHYYVRENMITFYELDSEFKRNMKILDALNIQQPKVLRRDCRYEETEISGNIVMHNGAEKGWERKLYPHFTQIAEHFIKQGMTVTSIGAPHEYIPGTVDATGYSLKKSAGIIKNHDIYVGTDTGTYHIAALMGKRGLVIFTATDPGKNWDEDFHKSFQKVFTNLPCQPCQKRYHFAPEWGNCQQPFCQNVHPGHVIEYVNLIMKGVL
jgi:ADP-heptose:LPS heptosyltransferase